WRGGARATVVSLCRLKRELVWNWMRQSLPLTRPGKASWISGKRAGKSGTVMRKDSRRFHGLRRWKYKEFAHPWLLICVNLRNLRLSPSEVLMNRLLSPIVLFFLLLGGMASAQRAGISQQLVFTPYRAGGIYDVGDTIGWSVSSGPATLAYAYKWTIRRNNAVVLKEGKLDL